MPVRRHLNKDGTISLTYRQPSAMAMTVGDRELDALSAFRREAANDVQHWTGLRQLGRFAKEQLREAQRREKAATLWIKHFTEVGVRHIDHMPAELGQELDLAFGAACLA